MLHPSDFPEQDGRGFALNDMQLDTCPLLAACIADEQVADDWESGDGDWLDIDEWCAITYQRWHEYKRACQDAQRVLCWSLLIEYTWRPHAAN